MSSAEVEGMPWLLRGEAGDYIAAIDT